MEIKKDTCAQNHTETVRISRAHNVKDILETFTHTEHTEGMLSQRKTSSNLTNDLVYMDKRRGTWKDSKGITIA